MSDLYTRPDEARKNLANSTKTGNFFQDTFTDAVSDGITLGPDGSVKREGLAWWMQGFTPGARSIAEQKRGIQESQKIDTAVQNSGLTDDQLRTASGGKKLTSGNVRGTVAEGRRQVSERITPLQQSEIDSNKTTSDRLLEGQREGNQLTRESMTNQMEMMRMENASRDKRYYADRIDAREARADELMFRRESMERADRRDEKNRRRESIQALVAGLSSLGAAFAV